MITQDMDMVKNKYQDAEFFIKSLGLKDKDVRKIIKANDWEKNFILQRAKELFIPFFEEFINNFESVKVILDKRKLNRGKRMILKDLETGIVYESLADAVKDTQMSFYNIRKHIKKGRFIVIGRTSQEKRLVGKDANNKNV